MNVRELRIGNIVYIPQTKTNEQIGCIEENGRFVIKGYKKSYSSIECLRPIPLTEKWLLKFGCIEVYENSFQDVDSTFIIEFKENKFIVYLICPMPWIELEYIKYVHQLQNLYFALTGYELQYVE